MKLRDYFFHPSAMSQSEMAQALQMGGPSQISQWARGIKGRRPGPHYCIRIEEMTRGMVTCEELNPTAGWSRFAFKGFAWPHHADGYPMIDPMTAAKQ